MHSFVFLHALKGLLPGHLQEEDGSEVDGNDNGTKDQDPVCHSQLLMPLSNANPGAKPAAKTCPSLVD